MFRKRYTTKYSRYSKYNKRAKKSTYGRGSRIMARNKLTNIVDTVIRRTSELKYWNVTNTATFTVTNVFNDLLSDVTVGTTDTSRVGDKVTARSLDFRYVIYDPSVTYTVNTQNVVRVLIVQWFPQLTGALAISDVLTSADILSAYNHDKRQMFQVLYDRSHNLIGGPGSVNNQMPKRAFIKIPRKHRNMQFNAGTVLSTNALYLFVLTAQSGAAITTNLRFDSTFRYYDS